MKYNWEHGQNREQEYYDVKVGQDYLCVFRNRRDTKNVIWMGQIEQSTGNLTPVLYDKKRNDKQRKIEGLSKEAHVSELKRVCVYCADTPEKMMKVVEKAYTEGVREL